MTENAIIEAVRAVSAQSQMQQIDTTQPSAAVADPSAVQRFQAAMAVDQVPFASEVSSVWRSAQENHQGMLHRIKALSELSAQHALSSIELVELQYEVANLSFQQEVVSKVADKSSNAIQTLIKNQ